MVQNTRYSKSIYTMLLHPSVLINSDGLMNEIAVLLAGLNAVHGVFPTHCEVLPHSSCIQRPSTPCHKHGTSFMNHK